MFYLDIVFNIPLDQTFIYSLNPETDEDNIPEAGKRVKVRFGNRKMTGLIYKVYGKFPENCSVAKEKIRNIEKIIDKERIFTQELFETALWISKYYLCSIGEAIFTIIPSGTKETLPLEFTSFTNISIIEPQKLSDEQKKAAANITNFSPHSYHYVFGHTGTGKTEVFLQAAEKTINAGKGVIYLVPEIGLTHQIIEAAVKRFGERTAVVHSMLSAGQKFCEWKKIINKQARIVIGARSAVFAPVPDLGMIIIDEEHDSSYKSNSTPRYHARQIAMYRCSKLKIPLVMGSATPSAEAWYLMQERRFIKHSLTKRLSGGTMPKINCIDLSKTNTSGCISDELQLKIKDTLKEKRQVILFLNRRGFSHFFRCRTCGFELNCKNCSVPLTYHKNENRLRCHYCSWACQPPDSCPNCGSLDTGYCGFGTEYIEAEAKAKFPNARILRIDTDTLNRKNAVYEKFKSFKNGDYDIMLGTQMIVKGLNFPNLKLAGIILADAGLHVPDFRAAERTFALITQAAGRAGRFLPDGEVVVQTYNPMREPVRFACLGKINEFYNYELKQRKLLGFPPFSRIIRLIFRSSSQNAAFLAAQRSTKILNAYIEAKSEVIGPAECPILKISKNYRYQIILRGKNITFLQSAVKNLLNFCTYPHSVYIECDIDPVSML